MDMENQPASLPGKLPCPLSLYHQLPGQAWALHTSSSSCLEGVSRNGASFPNSQPTKGSTRPAPPLLVPGFLGRSPGPQSTWPCYSWGWLQREGTGLAWPGCFRNLGLLWGECDCLRRSPGRAASQAWSLTQGQPSQEIHLIIVLPIT